MAKKRSPTSRKIAKISREERRKPKSQRKSRKQIIAQGINMTRRGKRGG
jgi:hypothetical protein